MTDFAFVLELVAYTGAVVVPAILLSRLIAGADGAVLAEVFRSLDPPWPRGVQEEEPLPWRLDRLTRRPKATGRPVERCGPVARPATAR